MKKIFEDGNAPLCFHMSHTFDPINDEKETVEISAFENTCFWEVSHLSLSVELSIHHTGSTLG